MCAEMVRAQRVNGRRDGGQKSKVGVRVPQRWWSKVGVSVRRDDGQRVRVRSERGCAEVVKGVG